MNLILSVARKSREYLKTMISTPKERKWRIIRLKTNYRIVDRLNESSIVVDLGTGGEADFSQELIERYGLRAYGFEPTRKHHFELDYVVNKTRGRFRYYKYAISGSNGRTKFFESVSNVSGSFFHDHVNVKRDTVRRYDVETIRLDRLFEILNVDHIDALKMNIEGAEYEAFRSVSDATLKRIDQILVAFHHNSVSRYALTDTSRIVHHLENSGFLSHTTDYATYLFFRPEIIKNPKARKTT